MEGIKWQDNMCLNSSSLVCRNQTEKELQTLTLKVTVETIEQEIPNVNDSK